MSWELLIADKLFAVIALLVGGWFLNRKLEMFRSPQARMLESFKSDLLREADLRRATEDRYREWSRETRVAIADLATPIATCNQEIAWLTWRAQKIPQSLTKERLESYDIEMKAALTDMFRSRVRVTALDQTAHEALIKACVDQVYKLDSLVATAVIQLPEARQQAIETLSLLYTEAENLYDSLLKTIEKRAAEICSPAPERCNQGGRPHG